ncbi:FAD:protein FMN transferase [Aliiglaciecola litoralis]
MASPCEILIDSINSELGTQIINAAHQETQRIEDKFSRYRQHNLMDKINHSNHQPVAIDDEAFRLLCFADTCFELSGGMFDITSGVLRKAWRFDGSDRLPSTALVDSLRSRIGWKQVKFDRKSITLPAGFELDFGGIGKEYAVDCVAKLAQQIAPTVSVLVNFGGDIQVTRPRAKQPYWQVGIENPTDNKSGTAVVNIANGGLATSGDANRFLLKDGVRYGHILNPTTGYPVLDAPRSVTVAGQHCIQSGLLATLALLQGKDAELFLTKQNVKYWCFR